jgi:hypothetical protein
MSNHLIAAFVAVLGLSLVAGPATAAPQSRCQNPIEASGTGKGALGAGTRRAGLAAIADFEQKASAQYGAKYGRFSKAQTVKRDCRSGIGEAKCVITARPCR